MPTDDLITSAANPLVKQLRALADRRHRRRDGEFVVEGVQPVWRAVEAGWPVRTLVVVPELLPDSARDLVERQRAAGVRVAAVSAELAGRLTERDRPPGLFAVVGQRQAGLEELPVTPDAVFAVLVSVANPGNLGTVLRTADAAGVAGVVLVGDTTDEFAPRAVKASMGSLFAVPVARAGERQLVGWARGHGVRLVATSGYADAEHWALDWTGPQAVLLGSEGEGLPDGLLAAADVRVRIPMVGTAESLNLAVAAGLVLYEARRGALRGG
jgi:RNA methyltransferase, TrmH family